MQIKALPRPFYRRLPVDDSTPQQAIQRWEKLRLYARLRRQGCSQELALEAISCSRSTYYRWRKRFDTSGLPGLVARSRCPRRVRSHQWSHRDERLVWQLRRRYPFCGKLRLHIFLQQEHGFTGSVSTVGRILAKGVRLGRIRPCAFYQGRLRPKRRRNFQKGHAQRWRYGMKASRAGQLVQIDHMSISPLPGVQLKEFKALCPLSKQLVVRCYTRATARNATRFLQAVLQEMPFPVTSLQVDGGSEFRAQFETACQNLDLPLYVLPPRRPQYNGCVERAHSTTRCEFWNFYYGELKVADINQALQEHLHFYHHRRPHRSLGLLTPQAFLATLGSVA